MSLQEEGKETSDWKMTPSPHWSGRVGGESEEQINEQKLLIGLKEAAQVSSLPMSTANYGLLRRPTVSVFYTYSNSV